jgi:hypothetical protein
VLQCLQATLSPQENIRTEAEGQLKQLFLIPGPCFPASSFHPSSGHCLPRPSSSAHPPDILTDRYSQCVYWCSRSNRTHFLLPRSCCKGWETPILTYRGRSQPRPASRSCRGPARLPPGQLLSPSRPPADVKSAGVLLQKYILSHWSFLSTSFSEPSCPPEVSQPTHTKKLTYRSKPRSATSPSRA